MLENKVIFILLDGLSFEKAYDYMGTMFHFVEQGKAYFTKVKAELPTLSRPLYEVLLTGTPCISNGILSNLTLRRSKKKSIFELAKNQGLKTAAAAYYWISELYNSVPFDYFSDREQHDENKNIQHGKFYFEDAYPDSHLIVDGEILRREYDPNFLLLHPMGIDYAGHLAGVDSENYYDAVSKMDTILAMIIPIWVEQGYKIIITADHGMTDRKGHGGTTDIERYVPLWILGTELKGDDSTSITSQLDIAPLTCRLLGIDKADDMKEITLEL